MGGRGASMNVKDTGGCSGNMDIYSHDKSNANVLHGALCCRPTSCSFSTCHSCGNTDSCFMEEALTEWSKAPRY